LYPYVLFDLDGTLTDPEVGIITSVRYALAKEGIHIPEDMDLRFVIGPPLQESFMVLSGNKDPAFAKRLVEHYRERFAPIGLYENRLFDGVPEMLETLLQQGKKCFMATSKPTVFAKRIAEHFHIDQYFVEIFGSELDGTRSHKGEVIRELLKQRQLDPRDCVMVGDREHDIIGAKENHMDAIGVTYGFGSESELSEAGAKYIAKNVEEILKYV
jgi:phosphoglycolate phosphatase